MRELPRHLSPKTKDSRTSVALHELDLLGTCRFDPRASQCLDPPANPDAAPGKTLRLEPCRRERTLVAFGDGDGEILGPPPPEVDINGAAAFAHRQHVAFHDCEPSSLGCDGRRFLRAVQPIIWIGPQSKRGAARGTFVNDERGRAGAVAHARREAGM